MAATSFELEGVAVERGGRRILGPIDVVLPADGPIVVEGPSGSGKSTLLRLLNRLDAPTDGVVRFRGDDLATLDPQALRRRVAMVFQRAVALPGSVADNVRTGRPELDDAEVDALLDRVGLERSLRDRAARDLSGGEAQRMALARALATDPEVVLLDEPTSALDPDTTAVIEDLARSLAAAGTLTIWVTHDRAQRDRLARHLVTVRDGRVVDEGPAS